MYPSASNLSSNMQKSFTVFLRRRERYSDCRDERDGFLHLTSACGVETLRYRPTSPVSVFLRFRKKKKKSAVLSLFVSLRCLGARKQEALLLAVRKIVDLRRQKALLAHGKIRPCVSACAGGRLLRRIGTRLGSCCSASGSS